jgi:hypothetical protein
MKHFSKKFYLFAQKISQNQSLTIHTLNRFHVLVRFFALDLFPEFRSNHFCGTNPALFFGQLADLANK